MMFVGSEKFRRRSRLRFGRNSRTHALGGFSGAGEAALRVWSDDFAFWMAGLGSDLERCCFPAADLAWRVLVFRGKGYYETLPLVGAADMRRRCIPGALPGVSDNGNQNDIPLRSLRGRGGPNAAIASGHLAGQADLWRHP